MTNTKIMNFSKDKRVACLRYAIKYAPGGLTQFAILRELLLMASGLYKMRVTTVCAGA